MEVKLLQLCAQKMKVIKWGVLFGMPLLSYLLFEFITGNLSYISWAYAGLNLMFFYMFYLVLFAVTGSLRFSYLFWNTVLPVLAVAEYFVVQFRARPIMIWDVMAVETALTVSENYTYEVTLHLAAAFVVLVLMDVAVWMFPFRMERFRVRIGLGAVAAAAVFTGLFYGPVINSGKLEISMWNPVESYQSMGYILCTLRSLEYAKVEAPTGYSQKAISELGQQIRDSREQEGTVSALQNDIVPTNIICIMNESFSDLSVIGDFKTNIPYLSYFNQLEENSTKGKLYVPIFGSMTSNSEYEFLTGNSIAFLPPGSVPYQVYMNREEYSLPRTLKQLGYRTVAMHPYPGDNWNRTKAYASLGFDSFLAEEFFEDSPLIRNYVSDRGNYDKIIQLTEEKEEGEPLFIFNVTMQNHGGYDNDYQGRVSLTDSGDFPMTEQYLSLIYESDRALKYLLDYYSSLEEPTMVVLFGDHQPSVEEEFYETLYQSPLNGLKPEDYARRYITPFLIWTNYQSPSSQVEHLSAQYLSVLMMQKANLPLTDYQYFLDQMRETAPVIHMMGYYNSDGVWESWTNWTGKKEYPIFHQFDLLQYNNIFGGKKRQADLFTLDLRDH